MPCCFCCSKSTTLESEDKATSPASPQNATDDISVRVMPKKRNVFDSLPAIPNDCEEEKLLILPKASTISSPKSLNDNRVRKKSKSAEARLDVDDEIVESPDNTIGRTLQSNLQLLKEEIDGKSGKVSEGEPDIIRRESVREVNGVVTLRMRRKAFVLKSFKDRENGIHFSENAEVDILGDENSQWLNVQCRTSGCIGLVPKTFIAYDQSIENERWYFGNASRQEVEELYIKKEDPPGVYLIRISPTAKDATYVLSVRHDSSMKRNHVLHYKIRQETNCFKIANMKFPSLKVLIHTLSETNTLGIQLKEPCGGKRVDNEDLSPRYADQWRIPYTEITLIKLIGKGNFAKVYLGKWNNSTEIAAKELEYKTANLNEIDILKKVRHRNLITFHGVTYQNNKTIYLVTEYVEGGSILDYFKNNGDVTLNKKILWSSQIASGMAYIESADIVHRDLAARNILVAKDSVKIADFGLSRILVQGVYQVMSSKLPVKWTAPECFIQLIYTSKSDVWSFGIVLVEIFAAGKEPYESYSSKDITSIILSGHREPKPDKMPEMIYDLSMRCWNMDPNERPKFSNIKEFFEEYGTL